MDHSFPLFPILFNLYYRDRVIFHLLLSVSVPRVLLWRLNRDEPETLLICSRYERKGPVQALHRVMCLVSVLGSETRVLRSHSVKRVHR